MLRDPKPNEIENWVCVMERGTEYEIEMAKNYLSNLEIPSNILSKRDSSYNLNIGDMALVYLYVPKEYETQARKAVAEWDEAAENAIDEEE
jgi:hypothetical protein